MRTRWWVLLVALAVLPLGACNDDDDDGGVTPGDVTPPSAITDLAVTDVDESSVTLAWTAPGDDGATGTADRYDIRYARDAITAANWGAATMVASPPSPAAAGTAESFTVNGLDELTIYFFAVKTGDEIPNWSDLSNVVTDTTLGQRSLIVANGRVNQYVIVDPVSGRDSVEIQPNVQFLGETTLGYQGRHVILSSPVGGGDFRTALYICDTMTGDNVTQLTNPNTVSADQPDGSPVEAQVVFRGQDQVDFHHHVYVVGEDGSGLNQLTVQDEQLDPLNGASGKCVGAGMPVWSPDGTRIAFDAGVRELGTNYPHNVIAVMNSDGSGKTTLHDQNVEEAHYDDLCWSADGNYILFIQGSDVLAVPAAGGTAIDLTAGFDLDGTAVESIVTSPYSLTVANGYNYVGSDLYLTTLSAAGGLAVSGTPTRLTDKQATGHAYGEQDWAPYVPEFD